MNADGWADWSTYRPSDLLLFSERTYRRLFELQHGDHGLLLPLVAVMLAALLAGACRQAADDGTGASPPGLTPTAPLLALAVAWAWIGWSFHLQRYASINWIAPWFGAAFGVQALLLIGSAAILHRRGARVRRSRAGPAPPIGRPRRVAAAGLLALAVAYPLLGLLAGRPVGQAELLGSAPDPTAIATLACFTWQPVPRRAWIVPLLWLGLSGATLILLGAPDGWVPPAAALVAVAACTGPRRG